jgi:hypothetical protein
MQLVVQNLTSKPKLFTKIIFQPTLLESLLFRRKPIELNQVIDSRLVHPEKYLFRLRSKLFSFIKRHSYGE